MMAGNVIFLSMISAGCAFLGTVILIHVVDFIMQRYGVDIYTWSWDQARRPSSPPMASISSEDKEKIETLRSSAIIRHLEKYTTTLNDSHMVETPNEQEKSVTSCASVEKVCHEDESEQSDMENGPNDNGKDEVQRTHICVPLPGQQASCATTKSADKMKLELEGTRNVPNICVICHEDYNISDEVCWSSNQECTHVFHKDCMVSWLTSLGWMKLKEQRESKNMMLEDKCLDYYDLECPICRSPFICKGLLHKNVRTESATNINV